jgi:hypothetical protein
MKTPTDIFEEGALGEAIDPRPVKPGRRSKNFIRYLQQSGYMCELDAQQAEHLERKMDSYIREAILADRLGRIGIEP